MLVKIFLVKFKTIFRQFDLNEFKLHEKERTKETFSAFYEWLQSAHGLDMGKKKKKVV